MSEQKIKSGSWIGTATQFKQAYIHALEIGIRNGVEYVLNTLVPEYAMDTGDLRGAIRVSTLQEVKFQEGGTTTEIKISLSSIIDAIINLVDYAVYHIDGKPHRPGDLSPYWYPTTPDTRPVNTAELRKELVRNIRASVRTQLLSIGFGLTTQGGIL